MGRLLQWRHDSERPLDECFPLRYTNVGLDEMIAPSRIEIDRQIV